MAPRAAAVHAVAATQGDQRAGLIRMANATKQGAAPDTIRGIVSPFTSLRRILCPERARGDDEGMAGGCVPDHDEWAPGG
jgi:hypothetical protein